VVDRSSTCHCLVIQEHSHTPTHAKRKKREGLAALWVVTFLLNSTRRVALGWLLLLGNMTVEGESRKDEGDRKKRRDDRGPKQSEGTGEMPKVNVPFGFSPYQGVGSNNMVGPYGGYGAPMMTGAPGMMMPDPMASLWAQAALLSRGHSPIPTMPSMMGASGSQGTEVKAEELDSKKMKRMKSNRESARRSRLRKRAETEDLGEKNDQLTEENKQLKNELGELRKEVEALRQKVKKLEEKVQK
jgi:hypothetical protein